MKAEVRPVATDVSVDEFVAKVRITEPPRYAQVGPAMSVRGAGELAPDGVWFVVHRLVNATGVDDGNYYTITAVLNDKVRGGWYSKEFGIGDNDACGRSFAVYLVVLPRRAAAGLENVAERTSLRALPAEARTAEPVIVQQKCQPSKP